MSTSQTIRNIANSMFLQRLPQYALPFTPATGKEFRKGIILDLVKDTGCTIAAASSHYAHAFTRIKESEPERVTGLGRAPEKNNGGRKKKVEPVQAPALPVDELTPDLGEPQQVFNVLRCKDSVVVAEGLSLEDARALVEKHAAQKKAKLYWL